MKTNVLFDKDKTGITGTLFVCFYNHSVKKLVSTKQKISHAHFKEYWSKEFQQFRKTTVIDYRALNAFIDDVIKTKNPFITNKPTGYVSFMRDECKHISNLNTKKTYNYIVNSFVEFINTKSLVEIKFDKVNFDLFREYKTYLELNGISNGTIRYYFIVHKSFINSAVYQEKTAINLPLKKFNLKRNEKKNTILNDADIELLRGVGKTHPLYKHIQFSLFQLFCNGLRFSDCLLIKYSDFKPDYLQIHVMKTKQVIQLPYSVMLIDILYKITGHKYTPKMTYNPIVNSMMLDGNFECITTPKREHIIDHIRKQPNQLLFSYVDPVLLNYDKTKNMNDEQYKAYILARVNYNNHLGKLKRSLKLSVDTFTSHSMRYAYTRISLEMDIPIHTISKSLGHSNVSITEAYIRDNFGTDKLNTVGSLFAEKFKPN